MNVGRKSSIGERRNVLAVQRSIETQDDDGGVLQSWLTIREFMGDVRAVSGRESYIAQGVNAQVQFSARIPYTEGIAPEMRLVSGSRTFDITAVVPVDGRKQQLELLCTERV